MTLADTSRTTKYRFTIDPQAPFRINFGRQDTIAPERPEEPVWEYEAPTLRLLDATIRWLALRRDRWNAWGELAERAGPPALADHMREVMTAERVATRPCTVIQYPDDTTDLLIGEATDVAQRCALAPLHQHRFADAAARERFRGWIDENGDEGLDAMLRGALLEGGASMGKAIDRIAAVPVRDMQQIRDAIDQNKLGELDDKSLTEAARTVTAARIAMERGEAPEDATLIAVRNAIWSERAGRAVDAPVRDPEVEADVLPRHGTLAAFAARALGVGR